MGRHRLIDGGIKINFLLSEENQRKIERYKKINKIQPSVLFNDALKKYLDELLK